MNTHTLTLGDKIFTVNPLPVEDSFDLQPKLAPILPEIGKLVALFVRKRDEISALEVDEKADAPTKKEALDKAIDLATVALDELAPIVQRVSALLQPAELRYIRRTLLRGAACGSQMLYRDDASSDGQPINILLAGRTMDVWRLMFFALRVSYPDFFEMPALAKIAKGSGQNSQG